VLPAQYVNVQVDEVPDAKPDFDAAAYQECAAPVFVTVALHENEPVESVRPVHA